MIITLNDPPTAEAGGPYTMDEGFSVVLTATGTDPEGAPVTYSWDLDNNGTFKTPGQSVSFAGVDGPAILTVKILVTDNGGLTDVASAIVTVSNVAPTLGDITAPLAPVAINIPVNASASFTDPGVLDTHTATWDWGDGSTSSGAVTESGGSGTAAKTYAYATPGIYVISLTVTDKDGGSATTSFQYVVVYDPNGGFVTGGGWIMSPAGALAADPSLTGKTTFGFVAKYKKGATVPDGNTEFQFHVAGLNFKSTAYEWLVVAGFKAQYMGSGTINGEGVYKFIIMAEDGKPDTFRIKIWTEDAGIEYVFYEKISPQAIGGGSISIQK